MAKTTREYWNTEDPGEAWAWIPGLEGQVKELTLAMDELNGHYTRLTRFLPNADTQAFGGKSHDYPEEVYIISGSLYDGAFDRMLRSGDYASRPPGERHGPFRTAEGCLVLEVSYPTVGLQRPGGARTLDEVRSSIDAIDRQMIDLMAQRSREVAAAGRLKGRVEDVPAPERVEAVISNVRSLAKARGLSEAIAEATYRAMIGAFIAYETEVFDGVEA